MRPSKYALRLLLIAGLFFPASDINVAGAGQPDIGREPTPAAASIEETTVYVARNDEVISALAEAAEAVDKGDWAAATDALQRVIEGRIAPQDRIGTMKRIGPGPLFVSSRTAARKALARMPPEGIRHYRSIYDAKAAPLLQTAIRSRNTAALKKIADLYPASSSADDALDAMARLHFEAGRPLSALWAWRRMLEQCPDTDRSKGATYLSMALCALNAGRQTDAKRYFALARKGQPPMLMGDEAKELPRLPSASRTSEAWPLFGGAPSRSALAPALVDPGAVDWSYALPRPDISDEISAGLRSIGRSVPFIHQPAVTDNRIIISGTATVSALNANGEPAWTFPEGGGLPTSSRLEDRITGGHLHEGVYYTVLEGYPHAFRAADGELLWRASEDLPDPDDKPAAAHTGPLLGPRTVFSPPIVTENKLWCVATRYRQEAETCMAVFDRTDGKLLRRVFLCSHNSPDHVGIGSLPAPPTVYGDTVFACSNTGVVAAVSAIDGSVRWLHRYNFMLPILKRRSIRESDRWANNPVLAVNGRIFAAPQDSDFLFAFDAYDGELLWRQPRAGRRYLVGVVNDLLLVSGRNAAAVNVETGKLKWESALPGGTPAGRPAIAKDGIAVPTATGLFHVEQETGATRLVMDWDDICRPGNIIFSGGKLFVAGRKTLTAIESWSDTRRRLQDVANPQARLSLAEVAHRRHDFKAARRYLDRALELAGDDDPLNDDIRSELARLHYDQALAATNAGRLQEAAENYELAARYPASTTLHIAALTGLARSREKLDDASGAANAWQRLLLDHRSDMYAFRGGLRTRCGWHAGEQIDELIETAGREIYSKHEADARKLLAQGAGENRSPWLRLIQMYPNSIAAGTARLRLAASYQTEPDKARHHLKQFVREKPHSDRMPQALLRLADACRKAGHIEEAADALHRLAGEYPDAKLPGKSEPAGKLARAELKRPEFSNLQDASPSITLPLMNKWRSPARLSLNSPVISEGNNDTVLISQSVFSKIFMHGFRPAGQPYDNLVCRDLDTGMLLWARSPSEWSGELLVTDDAIMLRGIQQILALEPTTGRTLWLYSHGATRQFNLPGLTQRKSTIPGAEGFKHIITAEADRINNWTVVDDRLYVAAGGGRLACIDTADGETIWEQNVPPGTHRNSLMVSQGLLAVSKSNPARVLIYDADTGDAKDFITFEAADRRITDTPALFPSEGKMAVVLGDRTVHLLDISQAREDWRHKCNFAVSEVKPTPDEKALLVVPNTLAARGELTALDIKTGERSWTIELGPGELETFAVAANRIATLLHRNNSTMARCYDVQTGKKIWESVLLGRMNGAGMDISAGAVAVWGDHMTSSAVLLSASDGRVMQRAAPDAATQISARIVKDTFCVASNRGCFGYAGIDSERISIETEELLVDVQELRSSGKPKAAHEKSLDAACRLLQLHRYRQALDITAEALSDAHVDPVTAERLFDRMAAAREAISEGKRPTLKAYKFKQPPTIDGAVDDDWHAFESVRLTGPEAIELLLPGPGRNGRLLPWAREQQNVWPPRWAGPNDLSARLYVGWDDDFFYIAVDVDDNIHRSFSSDNQEWRGDGLFMSVDCTNDGGYRYGMDDQIVTLALVDKPKEDREEEEEPGGEYHVKIKPDQSGVVYETALPWDYLKDIPTHQDGTRFGLNITVIDDDGSGSNKSVSWTPGLFLHSDRFRLLRGFSPELFGDIILEDREAGGGPDRPEPEPEKPNPHR